MEISKELQNKLICPVSKSKLCLEGGYLKSEKDQRIRYPIIGGIPILINEEKSLFTISDFKNKIDTTWDSKTDKIKKMFRPFSPGIGLNLKARKNYQKLCKLIDKNAKILVVGGCIQGEGMEVVYSNKSFEIIGSDVSFGPLTKVISDAHDIPFENETFDCVVVQAVLEHVLSPYRCVEEIHRVLKSNGLIYAETPFIQQVHMKRYDFTRFTFLGHRRLFRDFEEIEHAPLMGPGTALAWTYLYFITSFTSSKAIALVLTIFVHVTSFFFKYFDYYLINKPGSYDSAAAFFFLGKKSSKTLSDKDLLKNFKGME